MKGIVKVSFTDGVHGGSYNVGDEVEIPKGSDWVEAGFVDPIKATRKKKSATVTPPENTAA